MVRGFTQANHNDENLEVQSRLRGAVTRPIRGGPLRVRGTLYRSGRNASGFLPRRVLTWRGHLGFSASRDSRWPYFVLPNRIPFRDFVGEPQSHYNREINLSPGFRFFA